MQLIQKSSYLDVILVVLENRASVSPKEIQMDSGSCCLMWVMKFLQKANGSVDQQKEIKQGG